MYLMNEPSDAVWIGMTLIDWLTESVYFCVLSMFNKCISEMLSKILLLCASTRNKNLLPYYISFFNYACFVNPKIQSSILNCSEKCVEK